MEIPDISQLIYFHVYFNQFIFEFYIFYTTLWKGTTQKNDEI